MSSRLTVTRRRNSFTKLVGVPASSSGNPAHHHWRHVHIDALDTTKTPSTTTTTCRDRRSRPGSSRDQTIYCAARAFEQVPTLHLRHNTTGAGCDQECSSSRENRKGSYQHPQPIIVSLSGHPSHPSSPRALLSAFSTRPAYLPDLPGRLCSRRPCDQRSRKYGP